jgi:type I restriction enzyme S subunit
VALAHLAEQFPNSITDGPFGSNLKTSHYVAEGPRVVRLQNIGECRFIDERACISDEHFARLQKHRVVAGDILIAALGTELPRACLAPDHLGPAIVKADCIRLRPAAERVSARYLCYALNSFPVRLATRKLVHGVGRPRLNLSEIKSIQIPLPSIPEQAEIVAAIEDRFSLLDKVDSIIDSTVRRAERLRQAILKRAFEGRLVPQDPTEEQTEGLVSPLMASVSRILGEVQE